MLQIERILFPTDHSACADQAFAHATFLAGWHGAELHVLHVTETRGPDDTLLSDMELTEEEVAEQLHMTWDRVSAADADGTGGASAEDGSQGSEPRLVTQEMRGGAAADAILRYAEEHAIDLVVMGTHGRRGVRRLLLGSVAEEVVRLASCPVFTVCAGPDEAPRHAVRRVLVPVDFSDSMHAALAYARELAQTYGARIDLLHVVENVTLPGPYGAEPYVLDLDRFKEQAYEALGDIAREALGFEDVRVVVAVGHPASTVVSYAEEHESDLIVIPTHGHSGIQRLLLGSVTEKVVRMAPCPVFTIKSFGKSLLPPEAQAARSVEGRG